MKIQLKQNKRFTNCFLGMRLNTSMNEAYTRILPNSPYLDAERKCSEEELVPGFIRFKAMLM